MIYSDFQGLKLSALGMGCMRLPLTDGEYSHVDKSAVKEMVAYAMSKGINYYDTAWGYHDGESERVIGEVLAEYPRESFYLASKFPGYDLNNINKVEEIFEAQLKKCGVEYFDFYLVHNVCELNIDAYIDPQYRIYEYLTEQKRNGRIRHLGFSTHGTLNTMQRFLDVYGKDMEFGQIQLNWLDWKMQNAKARVDMLNDWNIPIWVMEPVRGGKLASLEDEYADKLKAIRPNANVVEWAFRFLQAIPNVKVTLSGMSNMEQLKQNIATYESEAALNDEEIKTLLDVADAMTAKTTVPCTGCRYCTSHCPMGLDIPSLIEFYNGHSFSGGWFVAPLAIEAMPEDKRPSACLGCRSCEAVCPQNIKISEMMTDFTQKLANEKK